MLAPMAFAIAQAQHRGDYVVYGVAKDPRSDCQAWKDLLVAAGVCESGLKLSQMPPLAAARTTTATLLRNAGVPDTVVRDILGHSQVQVTQESYMRTDAATMKAAALMLEASFAGSTGGVKS